MIPYFVPEMPHSSKLIPYLRSMDDTRWYSNFGPLHNDFTLRLANEVLNGLDADRLTLVSSGTSAIELALRSLNIKAGSRVLAPNFTFPATVQAILCAGLLPLLSDVDPHSWVLTPKLAHQLVKAHRDIAVVVPVAAFGVPLPAEEWSEFTKSTGVPVVIDAAPALGNQTIDDACFYAFSLHATKPISAGEGGIVVSPSPEHAERVRRMSNFGIGPDRRIGSFGTNSKLSEYHCAVGLAQLDDLVASRAIRRRLVNQYLSMLMSSSLNIKLQAGVESSIPSSLFVVLPDMDGDYVAAALAHEGVDTRRLYAPLNSEMPGFTSHVETTCETHIARGLAGCGLALPLYNTLTTSQIVQVGKALNRIIGGMQNIEVS